MDFLTVLSYVLACIETAALLMALVFATNAMKEKRANQKSKKKNVPVSKGNYTKAAVFALIYFALNFIRNSNLLG